MFLWQCASRVTFAGLQLTYFAHTQHTHSLASTYVLSKLTVLQHSSLNCLRRMFAIVATCLFFGVPITFLGAVGLLTSFVGFFAFTYFRNQRQQGAKPNELVNKKGKDSVV